MTVHNLYFISMNENIILPLFCKPNYFQTVIYLALIT